jgi:PilZ domain-containing protein
MPLERRRQVRKLTNVETQWTSITGADFKGAIRILDVSRSGARLEVHHPIVAGGRVRIKLRKVMEACLVYAYATPAGTWMAGCKFDRELSEEEMRDLVREGSPPSLPDMASASIRSRLAFNNLQVIVYLLNSNHA